MTETLTKRFRRSLLRKQIFDRDGGICAKCGRFDPQWQADHILALWARGPDRLENIQTLCRRHHTDKTKAEAPARAKADRLRARHEITKRRRQIKGHSR